MSIEKTSAIILSAFPYRESSLILSLFTIDHGRVSCIAKGVRKSNSRTVALERGQIIDCVIYVRPLRDIQTLSDIQVVEFFPAIRSDLEKTALRDTALELLLKSIKDTDPHPELFAITRRFCMELDSIHGRTSCFILLWRYALEVAKLLGFGIDLRQCINCGSSDVLSSDGGYFVIESGSIICPRCNRSAISQMFYIAPDVLSSIQSDKEPSVEKIKNDDLLRLTKLAITFCRLHMDIRKDFKSVAFIEEIL